MNMAASAFPTSLPGFQRLFPDDAACAAYLEDTRWPDGFTCDRVNGFHDGLPRKSKPNRSGLDLSDWVLPTHRSVTPWW